LIRACEHQFEIKFAVARWKKFQKKQERLLMGILNIYGALVFFGRNSFGREFPIICGLSSTRI
jgi:hypothetical protein